MTTKIKLNQVYPIPSSSSETTTALNTKANISDVETALSAKANSSDVEAALSAKANISDVETALNTKANSSDLNNYVPLSGGAVLTGTLQGEFYGSFGTIDNSIVRQSFNGAISYPSTLQHFAGNGGSGKPLSMIYYPKRMVSSSDFNNRISLLVYDPTVDNAFSELGIGYNQNGVYTTAPTPATSDNSTKIATTAYVKSNVPVSIGSATKPVYTNSNGVITACTYELNKSVPSDAVFTDTNTKVEQKVSTANNTYPMLIAITANATANIAANPVYFGSGIKANPSTSTITATTFSGSLSGNATSANAFSASKAVTLTGAVTGTNSSTAGWSVPTIWRSCMVGQSGSGASNPWYKVATVACTTANWDPQITFLVEQTYNTHCIGILRIHIRTGSTKVIDTNVTTIKWLLNSGFTAADFVLVCPTAASSTAELWTKIALGYTYRRFVVLSEGTRTDTSMRWTLLNASSAGQAASITTSGTQKASS